ncbi:MAG: methyltransferase domain-containing protein [Candidatus Levyibacteriota bacterium]|nr:MAG: methyltransferase domain-containing protein [Candidatus Levybacteria bacterium]
MSKSDRRKKHEDFHKNTHIQKRLINVNNFTYRIIISVINKYLKGKKKILDIGCGAGTICLYLAGKGYDVLGIDISQNAINSCNESAKVLGLENVNFERKTFPTEIPNDKFDYIICSEVIEHLEDDDFALKKIYALLKPNGIAIFSTPSENAPLYKLGLAKEFDDKVGHLRRYTVEKLVAKCKTNNFSILETRKTEGVLRNFLFLNPVAGKFVRFIKFFISDIVTFFDEISLRLFGESQIFVVVKKL